MPSKQKLSGPSEASQSQQNCKAAARKVQRNGYRFVDHHDRVAIIYDNLIHDLQPMEISKARSIHYNTVRHILHRFYEDGHLKIKKSVNIGALGEEKDSVGGDQPNAYQSGNSTARETNSESSDRKDDD